MDDQQRARELLSAVFNEQARVALLNSTPDAPAVVSVQGALTAITAALRAAPEGFVMVPVEPTEELTLRIAKALQASEQSGWTWEDCSPIEVEGWMELATAAIAAIPSARPQGVK